MKGLLGESFENVIDRTVERCAAGDQRQRIEISLHRHAPLDVLAGEYRIDHPVESDRIDRNVLHVAQQPCTDAARKSDDLRARHRAANFRDDALRRRDAPAVKLLRRQDARPGIEDLHRIGTGLQLADQIARRRLDQHVHQNGKCLRIAIGEQPRRRLVRRAVAGDHVARDRPRRSAEAQQRDIRPAVAALTDLTVS